jgi:hypothetical protein
MNLEDLKFIRKELHEAYEMNDKILIGYAINRLDTLILEETQQLQKGNIPNVSGQWVSVSEKLPPLDMPIYVYHSIGDYISESHRRTESYFQSKAMQDITYWQKIKIPEKPIDA